MSSPQPQSRSRQLLSLWKTESIPFLTFYIVSGLLCILIPAAKYRKSIREYQNSYYYQYQQQNQSNDRQEYDINDCKWWQWSCTSVYVNENGEYVDNQNGENEQYYGVPSWFSGWGNGNRSGDRSGDGGVSNSAALKFVYAWQVILFLGLLAYGAFVVYKNRPSSGSSVERSRMALQSLLMLLFLWTNTCFLAMWMIANGSIYSGGREMEDIGDFYNQFSVMMFLSNFWYTIWGLLFFIIIGIQLCRKPRTANEGVIRPESSMNYLPYSEPSVTVNGIDSSQNKIGGIF